MAKVDDLSRSVIPLDQGSTLICMVELSKSSLADRWNGSWGGASTFKEVGA